MRPVNPIGLLGAVGLADQAHGTWPIRRIRLAYQAHAYLGFLFSIISLVAVLPQVTV